jgi:hypothetical protein
MRATLAADRLYALSIRPQEWDGLREHARLALRWGPLADDPAAPARRHWFLLVVECRVMLPAGDPLAAQHPEGLEVLRCGWEAELEVPIDLPASAVETEDGVLEGLLEKIAGVVNDVAGRAGVGELLTAGIRTALVRETDHGASDQTSGG